MALTALGLLAAVAAYRFWRRARLTSARLAALEAGLPIGVAFVDREGRYGSINDFLAAINGVPAASHAGRHVTEILPPPVADGALAVLAQITRSGDALRDVPFSGVLVGREHEGERQLLASYLPVCLDGAVVGMYGLAVDVTAQRQAESVLRQEGEEFRRLAETLTVMVWRLTLPDVIRYANPAAEAYTGLAADDVGSGRWRVLVHPEDLDLLFGRWRQVSATGETLVVDARMKRASDGMYRWHRLHATPLSDAQGQVVEWLATGTDIHDQKRALAERDDLIVQLQRSEAEQRQVADEFRLLADMVPHMIWARSTGGTVDYVNQRCLDYVGMTSEPRPAADFHQLIHPDDSDARAAWVAAAAAGEACCLEARIRRHDGTYRWQTVQVMPVYDGEGRTTRWIGCTTDIEDHKQAIQVRETFLSVASHELKTPITALLLQLHVLKRRLGDTDPALSKRLDVASRHGERLTQLVNNLLDVSRIISGRFDDPQPVAMREVVDEVVDRFALDLEATGWEVIEAGPGPLIGHWDRLHVDQILTNLLTNALKYGQGSKITIHLSLDGDEACLAVGDHGSGIAAADLDRIFLQYHRSTSADGPPGHGLGLWIVQHLAERMGGRVDVRSLPGAGATFIVRLPLTAA